MKKIICLVLAGILLFSNMYCVQALEISNSVTNVNVSSTDIVNAKKFIEKLQQELKKLNVNDIETAKIEIMDIIYNLANNEFDSVAVDSIAALLLKEINNSNYGSGKDLVNSVINNLVSIIGNLATKLQDLMLNYDENVSIKSETASFENNEKINLNGYIYYAKERTSKWVILVHPFQYNGKLYAQTLAKMYLNKGYNVLAPDLRGFGKSEGSVAMGYLESLDIWDWLTYINDASNIFIGSRAASEVIVHGTSLGGATTLQLWTQKRLGRDIATKHVVGIIDDCGYNSMTGIIKSLLSSGAGMELISNLTKLVGKEDLYEVIGEDKVKELLVSTFKVGITSDFDLKQDSLNQNRVASNVPVLIIHGDNDTIVNYSIGQYIAQEAEKKNLLYKFWTAESQPHAFIVTGMKAAEYQQNVYDFLTAIETGVNLTNGLANGTIDPNKQNNNNVNNGNNNNNQQSETNKEDNGQSNNKDGFFAKLGKEIGNFFKSIGDFFKNLFRK